MGVNLIDLIGKQLSGDVLGKLGSLIGQDAKATNGAVGAAVPGLLAGISSVASKPEGAEQLFGLVGKQDPGLLGNLVGTLSSQGANVAQQGSGLLSSLLGNNLVGGIVGALSKFTGLSEAAISKLVGVLAPVVLGVLGKQVQAEGLNASGLAGLLSSQKDYIMKAMPSGFGSLLGGVPGLGGILGPVTSAASGLAGAAQSSAAASARTAEATANAAGASLMKYLIPIVLIVLLVLWLRGRNTEQTAAPQPQPLNNPAQVAAAESLGVLDRLNKVFDDATSALTSIKDPASATAALPKLQELGVNLDAVQGIWNQVPESSRASVRSISSVGVEKLQALVDKTLAIPGVGPTLKPVTDQLLARLKAYQ